MFRSGWITNVSYGNKRAGVYLTFIQIHKKLSLFVVSGESILRTLVIKSILLTMACTKMTCHHHLTRMMFKIQVLETQFPGEEISASSNHLGEFYSDG